MSIQIVNKKSKFEYHFIEEFNAGIVLTGNEVKSIIKGNVSLTDTFCFFQDGELFLKNAFISNEKRDIKLLLKKKELNKLEKKLINGLSIIPYRLFQNDRGLIKVEVVLVKGKKEYDKRETIKKRDIERDIRNKSY